MSKNNRKGSSIGITPNTVMNNVEDGCIIRSYDTLLAVFVPRSVGSIFLYSDDCRAVGQVKVSNTTRKHLRKYKDFYLSDMVYGIEVPHSTLLVLSEAMLSPHDFPAYWVATLVSQAELLHTPN